jgi:hypothetical protein
MPFAEAATGIRSRSSRRVGSADTIICALNYVLQLANVSGPWIVHQVLHRFP